ncbi:M23 family metallopeptidase [bacterium]|nr:M23 family metallopeptidase [bacterium]
MKINRTNFNQGISISDIKINDKPQNLFAGLDGQPVQHTNISKTDVLNTPSQKPVENSAVSNFPNWIMPCKGPISSEYNEQRSGYKHNGIDIVVPVGTPIKAIADGTVVVVGPAEGYGRWVGIDHGTVNGIRVSSEYGHLSRECVTKGSKVKQGDIIAFSGNTGHSSNPHLHLTIRHGSPGREGGKAVSPWLYINY